jgi:hypothetical protein
MKYHREHEFEGINVKQNDKEEDGIHRFCERILEAVAAEKDVVAVPYPNKDGKACSEGEESLHGVKKLAECPGNLERDNQQRDGKGKNGVAETFDAGDFPTPPSESKPVPELSFGGKKSSGHTVLLMKQKNKSLKLEA